MKIPELVEELDENLIEILDSCIQTGDTSILFDSLRSENSYLKQLDSIYLKINNDISNFCNDLFATDNLVSNALQILTGLIDLYSISEHLSFLLARTILFVIIDEKCSINNIKRAIHVLNSLVNNKSMISALVSDDSLEGALQIFGRKIPSVGDYECQALLYEALYRITCDKNREYWANIWFIDSTARNMFLTLDPQKFELNCRAALNYINRNEFDRRVFSVIACKVSFGSFELKQPRGYEFWVDFNYGSQSISFYCSELCDDDSLNDSALWETILINNPSVKSYYIETNETENTKEVIVRLNCPCYTLITSSSITNPAFNSFEIKLVFFATYDIYTQLETIYGREKYINSLLDIPKIFNCSDVIKCSDIVENGADETFSNGIISQRKVSDSSPIPIITDNNEYIIPETGQDQLFVRISSFSEPIELPKEEHVEHISYEAYPGKRIYNSEPIPLTPSPEIEKFQDTSESLKYSQELNEEITSRRKVSCSSVNIKINEHYKYQMTKNGGIQMEKVTVFQRKKAIALPTHSISLENNNNETLVNGFSDKIESNAEVQNNLKYDGNKFTKQSSISHPNSVDFQASQYNKNNASKRSDLHSPGIHNKTKVINTLGKCESEKKSSNDERNSITSDVFADVSMIEDSQHQKNDSLRKSEHYLRSNLKRPSSETLELFTAPREKVLRRVSSMSASHGNINSISELPEEDEWKITLSSKNIKSSSSPHLEKNEGKSNLRRKRKKRRMRRKSLRNRKTSPASNSSSSLSADINIKNLKPDKTFSAYEVEQKEICDTNEQIDEPFNSVNISVNNNITTSDKNLPYPDQNQVLNETDKNDIENLQKKINDDHSVILNENVIVIEDSFKEKECFANYIQNEENKPSSFFEKTSEKKRTFVSAEISPQDQENTFSTAISKIAEDAEKESPSKKLKTNAIPDINSSKNKDDTKFDKTDNESQVVQKLSGESSTETRTSESTSKKQRKSKRLYNLDNAPVYDVPPSKVNKSSQNSKNSHMEYHVSPVNTNEQYDSSDNKELNTGIKNDSVVNSNNQRFSEDKMKIYDKVEESDDDFEVCNSRVFTRTRKRPKTTPAQGRRYSKKKKTEASQTDANTKSVRTRREAAVKAMKVNKRILDPTPEVACDEIKVMGESDDSPKDAVQKPEKKRKYAKIFGSSHHTDTETGSSEVSWLKKSRPLFESPKKNYAEWKKTQRRKKSLPIKVVPAPKSTFKPISKSTSKPTPKPTHNISIETGSRSKSNNWSDIENFNLTVEKSTKKSYPILQALENDMKSLSNISHNRNVDSKKEDSSANPSVQVSSLNNNKHSKDRSDANNLMEENVPNNEYDNFEHNSRDDLRGDNNDISDYHEEVQKLKKIKKQKHVSNEVPHAQAVSDNHVQSASPLPQSLESNNSLDKERGSESNQDILLPENECISEYAADEDVPLKDFRNETKGKELHLKRFLECVMKHSEICIESQKSSSVPDMHSHQDLNHSKGYFESAGNCKVVNKKVRRSKTDELPMSWTRRKNEKLKSLINTDTFKKPPFKNLFKENSEHFKDCTLDDLCLRNSDDSAYQKDETVESFELPDKVKRKKIHSASDEELLESPQKRNKLYDDSTHLKNCTLDSLRHSSHHSLGKRSSKSMDKHDFTSKRIRRSHDSTNSELTRSGIPSKKTIAKSSNILENSLHSRLTTLSFKEIEVDRKWFKRITFTLSQDADAMTRRLLATVQKCFYEYSSKMCFLRENVLKATEAFELSSVQNVKASNLKNLIQTCSIIRIEVEKSLKEMQLTGKEYFDAENRGYNKLRHKYVKGVKKYLLGMKKAKKNAIHKLEGNVILKTKYFFRKFLKYLDLA